MGMFNTVLVAPNHLPEGYKDNTNWQTKSMDCNLNTYLIRDDERLLKGNYGSIIAHKIYNYTGAINFYSAEKQDWIERVALFKKGKLILLELVEPID